MSNTHTLTLSGCAPIPLAHYLKALGVLRLVSDQKDPKATGQWHRDQFVLHSELDREALLKFFLDEYQPTAVMVPWSGGDYFDVDQNNPSKKFDKTPTSSQVIEAVLATNTKRLQDYRQDIKTAFLAMTAANVLKKKDIEGSGGPQRLLKAELLKSLRNSLSDNAIGWIDAASVIEPQAVAFNALLGGGGGSDGNSHFSDNFMQCLWMTLPDFEEQRTKTVKAIGSELGFDSCAAIEEALFCSELPGTKIRGLSPVLFDSTRVGGPNKSSGFEAPSGSNPWDYILMLEGAILFAGALGRKIEHHREPSARFPFLFQSSPVGPGSSYFGESSGRELWLPLWRQQTPLVELRSLLSEGRIEKHGKMVKRGADAFVAAAQLGFDRGIDEFQRIGFFKGRVGGDNYFTAIDQGRIKPARNEKVDLLRECDEWLVALHFAKAGEKCPASVRGAAVDLERQIVNLATNAEMGRKAQMQGVLIGLGAVERAMARSYEWAKDQISPLTGLSADWKEGSDDDSPEFRLAASLASMSAWLGRGDGKGTFWLRSQLEPVDIKTGDSRVWLSWLKNSSNDVTWHDGDLIDCLNAIMARRIQWVEKAGCEGWPDWSPFYARLDDITDFIEGRIDPALLADLIWGLSLIDWQAVGHAKKQAREQEQAERITYDWRDDEEYRHRAIPSSFYALLKLCFRHKNDGVPIEAAIHQLARSGKGQEASRLAARRLRASGEAPLVTNLPVADDVARRTAAALLFPISPSDMKLLKLTLQHQTQEQPA